MELAALIVSIISLIGTIGIAIVQYFQNRRISQCSLEEEFFSEIYKDHLVNKLPEARKRMWVDKNKKLNDDTDLIDELNKIRQDSLYFMYNNEQFYNKLKAALQELEDFLINSEEKSVEESSFFKEVQEKISTIYKIISDAKFGKLT